MADPCSFSKPDECVCTNISWFVDLLFDKHVLDCHAELDFEVKENGVKNLVRQFHLSNLLASAFQFQFHLLARCFPG